MTTGPCVASPKMSMNLHSQILHSLFHHLVKEKIIQILTALSHLASCIWRCEISSRENKYSQQPKCGSDSFIMSSGILLLLLGLLTVWAELTPVSGQDRPKFCHLPLDHGPCKALKYAYFYNPAANECQQFSYGGCGGNANNFGTKDECHFTCVEKPGECPQGPQQQQPQQKQLPCFEKCQNDWNCPGDQKCCRYGCLTECKDIVYTMLGSPTRRPSRIGTTVRP